MAAKPKVRPFKTKNGYEYFVVFVDTNLFRDLSNDSTIINANLYARPREGGGVGANPLFQDGDILYDGMVVRQVPELLTRIPTFFQTAGAASAQVGSAFLCGQSAMAQFWGQMPRPTQLDNTDYQFNRGVGVEMAYGIGKIAKTTSGNLKDWGCVTGFFASTNDA
jgi:hypothetical protein